MSRLYLWIALLPVLWAHSGHAAGSADTWRSPTTLDVVLVTFDNETTQSGTYNYYLHDRPYGTNPNRDEDPSDRYLRRDFERLFVGGYDEMGNYDAGTVFVGDTVTVATDHRLEEVFGSVRAYYDSVSNGAFVLNVRMINPADEHGYPRWIELPNTKSHYAETNRAGVDEYNFWNDAYDTAMDSVSCWSPSVPDPSDVDCGDSEVSDYAITDIPGPTYTLDQRRRHKVVYLYSGAVFTDFRTRPNFISLLHPQADTHTATTPGAADEVGYRYVMGEREGWGNASRGIDEFAGIFTHAHEIGHLLGLYHGAGQWTTDPDPNPYRLGMYTDDLAANLMDWGLMQGRGSGPEIIDNGYHGAYSSCPNPINPFYRWDLGWLNPTEITENVEGYVIEPGTVHLIARGSVEYLLERRAHDGPRTPAGMGGISFGRYILFHEYENDDPGLFIWRRDRAMADQDRLQPLLIVADDRRIRDARDQQQDLPNDPIQVPQYQDMLFDPFPVAANATYSQTAVNAVYTHARDYGLRQTTQRARRFNGEQVDPGNLGFAIKEITRTADNTITVDIYQNYWAGELDRNMTWSGTVYVGGDVTIPAGTTLTIARGTQVRFLADTDDIGGNNDDARSELIVEGDLIVEAASGASDGGVTFRSDNTVDPSDDWYGIRVRAGGTATLSDVTIQDGFRCVQEEEVGDQATLTMTNVTLSNCGAPVTLKPTPPYTGKEITATLGIPDLDASITGAQWQRRRRSTDAWTDIASAMTATYTPKARDEDSGDEGDEGWQLRATVRYQAETGVYPHAQSAATEAVRAAPPRTVSFGSVAYQATEGGSVEVSVNLSPAPSAEVSIPVQVSADTDTEAGDYTVPNLTDGTVTLSFGSGVSSRSFTITANEDADSDDETLTLTFGTLPAGVVAVGTTRQATVRLLDNDGVVSLSSQSPRVGTPLTAELTDRSGGITNTTWQWQRRSSPTDSWINAAGSSSQPQPSISIYTPQVGDLGDQLQATVRYADADGTDQTAASAPTEAVQAGVPDPPMLTAVGRDRAVDLRIRLGATNGSPITRTEKRIYRLDPSTGDTTWVTPRGRWSRSPIDPNSSYYNSLFTVGWNTLRTGLTNGVAYTYEVRSVNRVGPSDVASITVRPGESVLPLTVSRGDGQVVLRWTAPTNSSTIAGYQVRQRISDSGQDWSIWSPVPGGISARSKTVTGLTNGETYQFEVQAVNSEGSSVAVSNTMSATPAAVPDAPPHFMPFPGDGQVVLEWEAAANNGSRITHYEVQSRQVSDPAQAWPGWKPVPGGRSARDTTVTGLTNGQLYEFAVRAVNGVGDGASIAQPAMPRTPPATAYAYRASQSAPLYDTGASGTPDHWSSSAITWTDDAPRVWRIKRTRPSGGTWSEWGGLEKYSERPAASATFYQRDSSAPSTPATQEDTDIDLAALSDWQTTQPTATATESVWSTTAHRAKDETQWIFTTPTQETPITTVLPPGRPRNFTADTGSPLTPGSIDLDWDAPNSGGTPTGYRVEHRFASGSWLSGATPTLTNVSLTLSRAGALYQFRVRAENSGGNSGWVETTGTTSGQVQPPETEYAYRLHTSGTTAPTFTASASTVPTGWYSSRQTPTSTTRYEWRISRTRPAGGSWSSWGGASVVSRYTETQTAYKRSDSGTSAPAFSSTSSGVPYGWSSSQPSPTSSNRYVWQISRTRPAGGSWSSWGSATVVSTYSQGQTTFQSSPSGSNGPSFNAAASGYPPAISAVACWADQARWRSAKGLMSPSLSAMGVVRATRFRCGRSVGRTLGRRRTQSLSGVRA